MTAISNKKPNNNFFSNFFTTVQDAPWYRLFLTPALNELKTLSAGSLILDVGTGPGKFLELIKQQLSLECVGSDISESMLKEARNRQSIKGVKLVKLEKNKPLPFPDFSFDAVSFCSVLFLLKDSQQLLDDSIRILRPGGKIVVLTPSVEKLNKRVNDLNEKIKLELRNWTFLIWRSSTKQKALEWKKRNILEKYAAKHRLKYTRRNAFFNLAVVEILEL